MRHLAVLVVVVLVATACGDEAPGPTLGAETTTTTLIAETPPASEADRIEVTALAQYVGHLMGSEQGTFKFTTSVTDLAVKGSGFLLVSNDNAQTFLTRAGSFVKNGDGDLVNAGGFRLMGYSVAAGAPAPVANGTAGLAVVNIGRHAIAFGGELLQPSLGDLDPGLGAVQGDLAV